MRHSRVPPFHHPYYYIHNWCWWLLWLILVGFVVTFIVLAVTVGRPDPYYSNQLKIVQRSDCTPDEYFDSNLQICAPVVPTPTPIVDSMKDTHVSKCQSFYHHMCGQWIHNHTNENRAFTYVYMKNQMQVRNIVTDPASGPIYRFYRSCLDTLVHGQHRQHTIQQQDHLMVYILAALQTHNDLPVVLGRLAKYGYNGVFAIDIEPHPTKPEMMPVFKPDTVPSLKGELARQVNAWHTIAKDSNNEEEEEDYMSYVASGKFDRDTMEMSDLIKMAPTHFWHNFLRELTGVSGLENDLLNKKSFQVWVLDRGYFRHLFENMDKISINMWRQFVRESIEYNTQNYMPLLPSDSYFRMHEWQRPRFRQGKRDENKVTPSQCVGLTQRYLQGLVAKNFLARYMPHHEQVREKVTRVVENLRNTYAQLLHESDWLSEETRQEAIDKIQSIIVRAVHPNIWETEPFAERITIDQYARNLNMVRRYRAERNFELWFTQSRTGKNRDVIQRFGAPLTTVNAYYSPITNTITVFAGIVQEPFFSSKFSDVAVYATLGMICGHELSHALDPSGRQFDKNGSIRNWWKPKDIAEFQKKAQCIVQEYGPPSGCVNANYGLQTLGEDMADITGITLAWRAFLTAHPTATIGEKRQFFEIFAQMWAETYDPEHLCGRVNSDVHAIAEFRVDHTLRQFPPYAETFGCKADNDMVNNDPCRVYG